MLISRVKIIRAEMPSHWYARHIGREFFVEEVGNADFGCKVIPVGVDSNFVGCYIKKSDAEIIDSFDGEVVTEIKVVKTGELDGEQ